METITTKKLNDKVGVEFVGVTADQLRNDDSLAVAVLDALEERGVVLFRKIDADDQSQVDFCRKLGPLNNFKDHPPYETEEVMEISFSPSNPTAAYLKSNDFWHTDGLLDDHAAKTAVLSARVVADKGGETEFASTYEAYDALTDDEKERFENVRVIHSFEAVQRHSYENPTAEQIEEWNARRPGREHPLVWTHSTGRRSLVLGATASHIVGMDVEEGRALLKELVDRATTPDRVYRHTWAVGDMVLWDNSGLLHRACEFDRKEPRRMHRSTITGSSVGQ
ncbi:TauD/TfdA dioxygenase family protein [Rhodococcus sp. P1Y]|uniref:TauD/TfdA dioxygenase family protein n=1 Tax=Rhodococcus sp. P1Y TaxID=1302308 RepID=UPI000EB3368C|nr:TauD/TfdA family dioxygenase [Rhodococcus sp. P1Y]AYJ50348.1 TauD/TfdA family dioxygenase [Rhodococcus sp. P1Y]